MHPTEAKLARKTTDTDEESDDLDVIPAEDITVAIFCALPYESAAVKYTFDKEVECRPKTVGPRKYVYSFGVIGEHNIVLARPSQIGTVKAAQCVTTVRQQFPNVLYALLIGIGAGIPYSSKRGSKSDIRLGDVAVSIPRDGHPGVVEYDYGKYEADGTFVLKGSLDKPHSILISADGALQEDEIMNKSRLRKILNKIIEKAGYARPESDDILFDETFRHLDGDGCSECLKCDHKKVVARNMKPAQPVVHRGLILSGSGVVKNPEDRLRLCRGYSDAICFEMEAAGIVDEIPCLVIRGICDYADTHKQDGWHYYAAAVAAAYGKALLLKIYGEEGQKVDTVANINSEVLQELQQSSMKHQQLLDDIHESMVTSNDHDAMIARQKILDWISPINSAKGYEDIISRKQAGTGQWFLESQEVSAWLATKGQRLFCSGMHGAGKSYLVSILIEELFCRYRHTSEFPIAGIAYIYFDYKTADVWDVRSLFLSLLKQISQSFSTLPKVLKDLHDKHTTINKQPPLKEILGALRSVSTALSRVFVLIDAIDECSTLDNCRKDFITQLLDLCDSVEINVLATSRDLPDISDLFYGHKTLQIYAHDDDIRRLIDGRMCYLSKHVCESTELREKAKAIIVESSHGILYLDSLSPDHILTKRKALTALAELPDNPDSAYRNTMERIECQSPARKELAKKALTWVVCTKRPLTKSELQEAVAIKPTDDEIDQADLSNINDIISVCAGLLTIGAGSDTIRLTHRTAQTYFDNAWSHLFPSMEAYIARSLITYLSFSSFKEQFYDPDCQLVQQELASLFASKLNNTTYSGGGLTNNLNLQGSSLYMYAAKYWVPHARIGFLDAQEPVCFLSAYPHVANGTLLNAAREGLEETVQWLVDLGIDPNIRDSCYRTPLHWAAYHDWTSCVKSLIDHGAKLELGIDSMTPLHWSVWHGNKDLIAVFLNAGISIDCSFGKDLATVAHCSNDKPTAFSTEPAPWEAGCRENKNGFINTDLTSSFDFEDFLNLFFESGSNDKPTTFRTNPVPYEAANKKKQGGLTSLHLAALIGSEDMVKHLLSLGANAKATSENGETPLHLALYGNSYDSSQNVYFGDWYHFLFSRTVDADWECWPKRKRELLKGDSEVEQERFAVFRQLLDQDMDNASIRDSYGNYPIHYIRYIDTSTSSAPSHLLESMAAKYISHYGVSPFVRNNCGQTPMHWACWSGDVSAIRQQIQMVTEAERSAFVSARDEFGNNALHYLLGGAGCTDATILSYLLTYKVEVNDLDDMGFSPLARYLSRPDICSSDFETEIVRLLFQHGACPKVRILEQNLTLAHLYAGRHQINLQVLQILVAAGVDLEGKDNKGRTVLHHMATGGGLTPDLLNYLCNDVGLSKTSTDDDGMTALDLAAKMREHCDPGCFDAERWSRTEALLSSASDE